PKRYRCCHNPGPEREAEQVHTTAGQGTLCGAAGSASWRTSFVGRWGKQALRQTTGRGSGQGSRVETTRGQQGGCPLPLFDPPSSRDGALPIAAENLAAVVRDGCPPGFAADARVQEADAAIAQADVHAAAVAGSCQEGANIAVRPPAAQGGRSLVRVTPLD